MQRRPLRGCFRPHDPVRISAQPAGEVLAAAELTFERSGKSHSPGDRAAESLLWLPRGGIRMMQDSEHCR